MDNDARWRREREKEEVWHKNCIHRVLWKNIESPSAAQAGRALKRSVLHRASIKSVGGRSSACSAWIRVAAVDVPPKKCVGNLLLGGSGGVRLIIWISGSTISLVQVYLQRLLTLQVGDRGN